MNYTLNNLSRFSFYEENDVALESYKTMKLTMDNFAKVSRFYTDRIDVESDLKKIIAIEKEYVKKIDEFYSLIEDDKYSIPDTLFKKYIPNFISFIGVSLSVLVLSKLESTDNEDAKNIMRSLGLINSGIGLIMKVKNSDAVHFKNNALDTLNKIKLAIKYDINIYNKCINVGITSKSQFLSCKIKINKEGIVEIYRKY